MSASQTRDRKATGSYYTPPALVEALLNSSLQPLIEQRMQAGDPEAALLGLTVCDPACGAGAFLTAAAERIAHCVALVRTGADDPPAHALRAARRDVAEACIYGVDLNPAAVELATVAMAVQALDGERPNPFLGHRIKRGNALIGATPALLDQGTPDAAFTAVEGDDPAVARELQKRNRAERAAAAEPAQGGLF